MISEFRKLKIAYGRHVVNRKIAINEKSNDFYRASAYRREILI